MLNKAESLIIIPTYNESKNIAKLIAEIIKLPVKFHILVVDDNSPDGTGQIVDQITKTNSFVNILHRNEKSGLGNAYKAGFKWALKRDFTHIISMDADFSHHPKYLSKLLEMSKNNDIVIGSRYINGGGIKGWGWNRYLNSWGANLFTKFALGLKPNDVTAGFKCYSRKFIESLDIDKLISSGYAFQVEMVFNGQNKGFSITEVPIIFEDRTLGKSKISGELKRSAQIVVKLAWSRVGLRQFIKFAMVGVLNTIIDWSIYGLIINITGWNTQIFKQITKTISFVFAVISSYILNRKWTFKSVNNQVHKEAIKFFSVAIVGLILNNTIFYLITGLLHWKDIFGLFFATALVTFWNFFVNKYWVFRSTDLRGK